ncbi:TetR/AcrR family transcriptional regulator [Mycolicibacterium hodleri]|uniref:TetR/AcrR family transcriptional regulator n=1 Tax=Mycolicibacterium hodleri TaxID=49897 RepID=A0A502E4C0_9MYCO|nr:TetR/AcrR family transcriptional regulator [Mycolicibacterium hodleri]TPG32483.1 TetR/AcrR family transcriptional regulator [Mycolicibacterium hodleri]
MDTAIEILADNANQLTTSEIARRLGVSQPTLYSHVASLDRIRELAAIRGVGEISRRVRDAVRGRHGEDELRAMAHAYRQFVRDNPALYLLQMTAPRSPAFAVAAEHAVQAVRDVLRERGLSEDQVVYVHAAVRASIHGFVDLEAKHALGDIEDADKSFDTYLEIFVSGIAALVHRSTKDGHVTE